ncbi:complexin-2 [Anaerotignum lactatifermentans]|uniref:complexin-2 n=1 Tax=Anaerotignum lactatifermentans TaxID=160404 RepID=UPI003AB5FF9D
MRNVQISQELFMQLLRFHLMEDESCEKEIKQELEKKMGRMVMRDLFGKSKTASTEEEREQARKEYLDRRGVSEKFRW